MHPLLFRTPSQKSKASPSLGPIRFPPSPCLCQSCLPIQQHDTYMFYLRRAAGSQSSQILGTWHGAEPSRYSGGGSRHAIAGAFCPREAVAQLPRGSAFMVKCSKEPASRLAALSRPFLLFANEAALWCPRALLSLERQCRPSQMQSKEGNCLSPCNPGVVPSAPGPLPPSPQEHHYVHRARPQQWCRFLKLQTSAPLRVKTCNNQPLPFSQSVVWGTCFSCAVPCVLPNLFLSLLSP